MIYRKNQEKQASPAAIREQLSRILASQCLAGSDQLRRFLEFVVIQTMEGRAGEVKEYLVGVEVFGRGDSFDPRIDPIVRVQARRLRAKLDEYYQGEGAGDPVRITLPKGSYSPIFENSGMAPARRLPSRLALLIPVAIGLALAAFWLAGRHEPRGLVIAVLPLENLTGDSSKAYLADKITEGLTTGLAKDGRLRVRSRTTAMRYRGAPLRLPEIARELGASVVVEGGVAFENGLVLIKVRAVDAHNDVKIWAGSEAAPVDQLSAVQAKVVREIAGAILP